MCTQTSGVTPWITRRSRCCAPRTSGTPVWVVRVGGDDRELRPWHCIYEGRRGRCGTPTIALHVRKPLSPVDDVST